MEALMQHLQAAGFSEVDFMLAAAPRRSSTKCRYDDRCLCFASWAAEKGIVPLGPTATQVVTVFPLQDTRSFTSTVKGYRSCLGSVLSCTGKAAVVQDRNISDMISSM